MPDLPRARAVIDPAADDAPPRTYCNPILDRDFPDPAALLADDGYYYAYATQSRDEHGWINIQVARSADLVAWEHLGDALPVKPDWAAHTQDFWAPSVVRDQNRFVMFYSAKPDTHVGEPGHSLGIAIADRPGGPFIDIGRPFLNGEGFEVIDPMVLRDPASGRAYLYWGSGFQPIKVQELSEDLLSFAPGTKPTDIVWPNPVEGAFPRLVEAAWVSAHEGAYYLFYSGDNCCGPQAEYGVMVARATNPLGPFETLEQARGVEHSLMLTRNDKWLAPGHNGIVTDSEGIHWMLYHAVDIERPRQRQEDEINSRRVLLIDRIEWEDGWPVTRTPSTGEETAPAV
ncbi:glycoside hydrolase family 43 protein [Sphingomonas kaistensis]|uniref:Glycoside hydrolase family 43 protein n=1 Tax=Sphingomonas kaistensis TaxID=298708 RepID=A0ABZ2G1X8_9SPHN